MRLGQLSRKLDISIPQLVSIIAEEFDVTIGEHPNIKLDDSHVDFITVKFDKPEPVSKTKEILEGEPEFEITDVEEPAGEMKINQSPDTKGDTITVEEAKEIETIRAKAAKLEGLKVVDKIDLPPPPPPEMVEIDGVMYDKAELKKQRIAERKERDANRKKEAAKRAEERKIRVKKRPVKKELSFAEKRRIEEEKEERIKNKDEKYKRNRQKKHYDSKHRKTPTSNNKKKIKEPITVEVEETVVDTRPAPKTMLGKFWRWLNTY
jgi:hypothetical protein